MPICLSHGGPMIYSTQTAAEELLIGTVGGVFRVSRAEGGQWSVLENTLEKCHVSSLAVEPQSGRAFAGVYKGGLYASEDSGKTWRPSGDGLASNDVYSLNFVEQAGQVRLYAGTEPAHLHESDDLGEKWHELSSLRSVPSASEWTFPAPPHTAHVKFIAVDPQSPKTVYAAIEVGGLLKSVDGGETWEELHGFYEDVHRVLIRPSDPRKVYITTGAGIYHSQDGGKNWTQLTNHSMRIGYPDPFVLCPGQEDLMFTAGARNTPGAWRKTHTADARIGRSRDGGKSWTMLREGLPKHMRCNVEALVMVKCDGSFELFAGTTDGDIYYSSDEGEHWTTLVSGLPPISKFNHYRGLR